MKHNIFNIKFGLLILILAALFAFYLGFSIESVLTDGKYAIPFSRIFTRAGHTHGMLIGLYNVIIGLILTNFTFTEKRTKIISIASALAVLLPIGLIVRGATGGAMTFAFIPMIGAISFLISLFVLLISFEKCK